jgi:hypothetical protein
VLVVVSDHPFGTGLEIERSVLEPLGVELVLAPAADEQTLATLARESAGLRSSATRRFQAR